MDRRVFLSGLAGLAGVAAFASVAGPSQAIAGVPNGRGILDELDATDADPVAPDGSAVEQVWHRGYPHRRWRRRPRRRLVWRRVCRRYIDRWGRWRRRCFRQRVWAW